MFSFTYSLTRLSAGETTQCSSMHQSIPPSVVPLINWNKRMALVFFSLFFWWLERKKCTEKCCHLVPEKRSEHHVKPGNTSRWQHFNFNLFKHWRIKPSVRPASDKSPEYFRAVLSGNKIKEYMFYWWWMIPGNSCFQRFLSLEKIALSCEKMWPK